MITIVIVLVLIVVLAAYYCWSTETAASLMELAVLSAETAAEESAATKAAAWKTFSRKGVKQYLRQALLEEELEDISLPRKSNHLFSEATYGEWGKIGCSHYGKGVTIRDYRRGSHLSKKVLHPCMGGEPSGYFD